MLLEVELGRPGSDQLDLLPAAQLDFFLLSNLFNKLKSLCWIQKFIEYYQKVQI
jgi:hypothetical protein